MIAREPEARVTGPESRILAFVLLAAAAVLALYFGHSVLRTWTFDGLSWRARSLGDTWPLLCLVSLGLFVVVACLPGKLPWSERLGALTLALLGWSLGVVSMVSLPDFAAAADLGAGPLLRPYYLALILGSGAFALGRSPWQLGLPLGERALLLYTFWCTANGKLFAREANPGFALINLAGLVTVVLLASGLSPQAIWRAARARLGTWPLALFVALPVWWFFAAVMASSREPALHLAWRLGVAALVALVAVGSLGQGEERTRRTARRLFGALVLGLGVVLVGGLLGIVEAAGHEPLELVLASRLRLLGLHPNLGAALFAAGLPLAFGWIFAGATPFQALSTRRRFVGSLLVAGAVLVLFLSGSRASSLGAVVGFVAFIVWFATPLAERTGPRLWIALGLLGVLAVALFLSPLGDGVRAVLDAKAETQSALGQRWHIWRMSGAALAEHPLTGLGPLGFSGHAQYAQASYYDGTSQTLHTHNLFLAASEGAGWIGLGLFVGFLGGLFEVLRRAVSASPRGHRDRALSAAVFAAVLALLACNQLDLGQSQMTFLPLLFWSALTIGGLQRAAPARASGSANTWWMPALGLLLIWPAVGATLVGLGQRNAAQLAAFDGDAERATEIYSALRSPLFLADDLELGRRLTVAARRSGNLAGELQLHAEVAAAAPDSPLAARRLAKALVSAGRYRLGGEAAARAYALDPRGENAAPTRMLEAWAALGMGDRERGVALFVEALAGGATVPGELRASLDGLLGNVDLLELLHGVGASIVAQASTDEVTARRRLAGLQTAFRDQGDPAAALPYLRGVIEASAQPIRATYYQEIVLLRSLGREDEARAVWLASPFRDEVNFREFFAGLDASESGTLDEGSVGAALDIFFIADRLKARHLALALELAAVGDFDAAHGALDRALFNASDANDRVDLVLDYMRAAGGDRAERSWQLATYLARASVAKKRARDIGSMVAALETSLETFGSAADALDAVEGELGSLGPVEETLRVAVQRLTQTNEAGR